MLHAPFSIFHFLSAVAPSPGAVPVSQVCGRYRDKEMSTKVHIGFIPISEISETPEIPEISNIKYQISTYTI